MSAYRSLDRSTASLGPLMRAHKRMPRVGPAPLVLSTVAAAFAWLGALSHEKLIGVAVVLSGVALIALVALLLDIRRLRTNAGVVVHEHGLHLLGARASVVLWDEVSAVELKRITRANRKGSMFVAMPGLIVYSDFTEHHWILRVRAGTEIIAELSDDYEASNELAETIREAIAQREIPKLLESENGTFGPIRVTKAHLDVSGRLFEWSNIADVRLTDGSVFVLDHAETTLARVWSEKVPNAHVLVNVCQRLIAKSGTVME